MELKAWTIDIPIEEYMQSQEFDELINQPAKAYYDYVYNYCTEDLMPLQKELFDDWWFNRKVVPSDECYWKKTDVPEGFEQYTPEDIKIAHDRILTASSLGCG